MSYRIEQGRGEARSARGKRGWVPPLVSLGVAGALAAVWACVPRVPVQPVAVQPSASQGFVATAAARPLAPPPAPATSPSLGADLERELKESARREVVVLEAEKAPAAPLFRIEARHEMSSTMYCLKGRTRTGIRTRDGVAAADPEFLPLGSVVRVSHPDGRPLGVFVIMDTGGAVKGPKLDIYVDDCAVARRWGRKKVVAEVLDLGREAS